MKEKWIKCAYCETRFDKGEYKVHMGIKGVGEGVGNTSFAFFNFCDLDCCAKFIDMIDDEESPISPLLEQAGL